MAYRYANYRAKNNVDFIAGRVEGKYDIPVILPESYEEMQFVPFNYAKSVKKRDEVGIHFFVDDYQFDRLWTSKWKYLEMLAGFRAVMSPDFSTYTDWPVMVQMFNHYRKHLLAAWMQENGIRVYQTISWSDETSYEWCFDGEPHNATVCISSVGTQMYKETRRLFIAGYERMIDELSPETILFYGKIPEECKGNIVHIEPFQNRLKELSIK